jgi:tetrahydromethanopterin S-methyltransferase subunit H
MKNDNVVYDIGNVTIGGLPGEYAPVMIGSIFYSGDPCLNNPISGEFDRDQALRLLETDRLMSEEYGLPRMVDIIGETGEAMRGYIDFVAEADNAPFLIDSMRPEVRMAGAAYAMDQGLGGRAIYNSLDVHWSENEIEGLNKCGIKAGVILAFDAAHIKPDARMELLHGSGDSPGLLEVAQRAGLEKTLVDPGVLDLVSMGWTSQAINMIREETGLPCGCAPSNALYSWRKKVKLDSSLFEVAGAAILCRPVYAGADFLFYGSLSNASWAYAAAAMASSLVAYETRLERRRPKKDSHPLYRLFGQGQEGSIERRQE